MVDPRLIEPNPWNSNVVSHENEEKLRASIERHGMFKPVLVRRLEGGEIQSIGGQHRVEQAIELGYTEVPVIDLGVISDEQAKEISLADNARYGIDDTLRLSEILGDLDTTAVENFMPWTNRDIAALTASLSVDIDNLDLDEPTIPDDDDQQDEAPAPKTVKTHQNLRFRNSIQDAARISNLINRTMADQGFTKEDDLTNAGDALAYLLLQANEDDDAAV
jgi:ParB-like chromosome segregation protein Spo0J